MKRQRGFTLVELLIVLAIIGILAAIVWPALANAKAAERFVPFKETFGVELPFDQYDTTTQLTDEQRALLRPLVTARLAQACAPVPEDVTKLPPSFDPAEVQRRLVVLRGYNAAVSRAKDECDRARAAAQREGLLPQ